MDSWIDGRKDGWMVRWVAYEGERTEKVLVEREASPCPLKV